MKGSREKVRKDWIGLVKDQAVLSPLDGKDHTRPKTCQPSGKKSLPGIKEGPRKRVSKKGGGGGCLRRSRGDCKPSFHKERPLSDYKGKGDPA